MNAKGIFYFTTMQLSIPSYSRQAIAAEFIRSPIITIGIAGGQPIADAADMRPKQRGSGTFSAAASKASRGDIARSGRGIRGGAETIGARRGKEQRVSHSASSSRSLCRGESISTM